MSTECFITDMEQMFPDRGKVNLFLSTCSCVHGRSKVRIKRSPGSHRCHYLCLYSECEGQAAFNKPVQGNPSERRHCVIDRRGLASSGCQFTFFSAVFPAQIIQMSVRDCYWSGFSHGCLPSAFSKEGGSHLYKPSTRFPTEIRVIQRVAVKFKTKAKM